MVEPDLDRKEGAVLLVSTGDATRSAAMETELRMQGVAVEATTKGDLPAKLEGAAPRAIVLSIDLEGARSTSLVVRSLPKLSPVPLLWCMDAVDDLVFGEAYTVGADDIVRSGNWEGLARRLRSLPEQVATRSVPSRGTALLADADQPRRVVLARLLRNAGYDVDFAVEARELAERARSQQVTLVIADVDLEEGRVLAELDAVRSDGSRVPWILRTPPKKLRAASAATRDVLGAWVSDSFAPPENVLYAINEAMRGAYTENRASPRLLYGTEVAFRVAGRESDELGFVYNVSGEGLYIRTMAPLPPGDDAWLELKPPRTDRRVRLEARVVWRRPFGPVADAVAPPGFGVRITGGSESDLERYRRGYQALAKDFAGIRFSSPPATEETSSKRD